MPPRKAKVSSKENVQAETPIVFFLKIKDDTENNVISAGDVLESIAANVPMYSDVLTAMDSSNIGTRFNTDLLKTILSKTTSLESYGAHTACFWCCHGFSWSPAVLPISYDAYKNIYNCEGHFCSPECALAYNYSVINISDSTRWNRHSLLSNLYKDMYRIDRILSPAPPRELLRMFGGYLDIEQFRDYIAGSNDIVLVDTPPIRLHFPSMNVQGPLRDIKRYVSLSTDVVEKASEQLRLKRSKPVNANVPTLDMCIRRS